MNMNDQKVKGVKFLLEKDELGDYIKERRLALNLTQEALAEQLFISGATISKWENGRAYPDITIIAQICRVLNIAENELISVYDDTDNQKLETEKKNSKIVEKVALLIVGMLFPIPVLSIFIMVFGFTAIAINVYSITGLFTDWGSVSMWFWEVTGIPAVLITMALGAVLLYISWLSWIGLRKYMNLILCD